MNQANPFFQGGTTLLDPVALALTLALGVALLVVKRRWVLLPLCLALCFLPMAERIVIAGLDFDTSRIMILCGWARILARGEFHRLRTTPLDQCLVLWLAVGTLFCFLGVPSTSSLIYRAGITLDVLGMFFLCRVILRNGSDVADVIMMLCWISLAITPFMAFESVTGFNPLSILGGVEPYTLVRDGRVRAHGSFAHPIMAGTFGATLFPLAIALWRAQPHRRLTAAAGLVGAVALTVLPASSGAAIALLVAAIGWGLWIVRDWMRLLRWGAVVLLVVVHFAREAPVWHLIGRVSELTGGTGWHRYALIDAFINNWRDWILVGLGTRSTGEWGWGLEDLTNQFVAEGVRGGIATLVAFVALVSASFMGVSRILTRARRAEGIPAARRRGASIFGWGLGVALAAHCASWISVSYFGQMWAFLYLLLAMIAVLSTDPAFERRSVHLPRRAPIDDGPPAQNRPPAGGEAPSLGRRLVGPRRARLTVTPPGATRGAGGG